MVTFCDDYKVPRYNAKLVQEDFVLFTRIRDIKCGCMGHEGVGFLYFSDDGRGGPVQPWVVIHLDCQKDALRLLCQCRSIANITLFMI